MDLKEEEKIKSAFESAVQERDVEKVRELLSNKKVGEPRSWWYAYDQCPHRGAPRILTINRNDVEIMKLMVEYGGSEALDAEWIYHMFSHPAYTPYLEEIMIHIVNKVNDTETLSRIFQELLTAEYEGPLELTIVKLLFDHGLPVDSFIEVLRFGPFYWYEVTLLHASILNRRKKLVRNLIQ